MIRINLLPIKALQAEVTRRREVTIGGIVLGGAVMLMAAVHLYQSYTLSQSEKELAGLRQEIQALNVKVKEVGDLQNKIKDFKSKNKIIEDLNKKKSGPVLVMESLSRATPTTLWLTDLRESGGSVTLNGVAADNETIADFLRALENTKYFSAVELVETAQGAGPTASLKKFSIRAAVVYRPADSPPADAKIKADGGPKKAEKVS